MKRNGQTVKDIDGMGEEPKPLSASRRLEAETDCHIVEPRRYPVPRERLLSVRSRMLGDVVRATLVAKADSRVWIVDQSGCVSENIEDVWGRIRLNRRHMLMFANALGFE